MNFITRFIWHWCFCVEDTPNHLAQVPTQLEEERDDDINSYPELAEQMFNADDSDYEEKSDLESAEQDSNANKSHQEQSYPELAEQDSNANKSHQEQSYPESAEQIFKGDDSDHEEEKYTTGHNIQDSQELVNILHSYIRKIEMQKITREEYLVLLHFFVMHQSQDFDDSADDISEKKMERYAMLGYYIYNSISTKKNIPIDNLIGCHPNQNP